MTTEISLNEDIFRANPAHFLEAAIKEYVARSPLNRLDDIDHTPIFDEPLVGFADGDDPIFTVYKAVIGDFHLTPREVLNRHLAATGKPAAESATVGVISWVLPTARQTRLANRRQTQGPSLRWNHTRWHGQDFVFELSRYAVALLEGLGQHAVAPELSPFFEPRRREDGPASTWSQRHIAYAAGLGTFGFNDGLITPRGQAMRCGSVVTDMALPPSLRPYASHTAHCLFYATGGCRLCMARCPGGAITAAGHDKDRCRTIMYEEMRPWLNGAHGEGFIGSYAGCGLCQTKVPCEAQIPPVKGARQDDQEGAP